MKDLISKLTKLEATAPKPKKMLTEDSTSPMITEPKSRSLKDVFSELSENIAPGTKPLAIMDPTKKQAGMGVLSSPNQAVQNILKNLDPKDVQVVMTQQQPGQTPQQNQQQQTTAAGQPNPNQLQTGQQAVQEKDEGKPGKNFAKIAKSAGKRYGSKEAGERVAGAVRAKLAKQGKLEEEQLDEISNTAKSNYAHKAASQMADNKVTNKWDDKKFMRRSKSLGKVQNQLGIGRSGSHDPNDKIEYMKEGAKVDRMVKHIAKSEREAGKSKDKAEDIAWATVNKRGYLDNKNKKKTNESTETEYKVLGQYDAKTSKGYDTRPVSVKVKAASEKEAKELAKEKLAHNHKNYRPTKVETLSKKVEEADIPSSQGIDTRGAGLGAGRSATTLESKKPDFLDLDKDGNKKEPMKKAAADKKKQKVKESMNHKISAARLEGKTHGLRGNAYYGKSYEDLDEMRAYHEGYKEGLDECYGQGVYENAPAIPAATVGGMANRALSEGEFSDAGYELEQIASQINDLAYEAMSLVRGTPEEDRARSYWYPHIVGAISNEHSYMGGSMITMMDSANALMEEEMDEGNAFTAALAKTPKGGKFSVGGNTFTDRTGYDAKIDEYAFESLDKQLSDLLNEGLSVSVSKGQQNTPDSVTITAQDQDADQLLQLVKHAGLGLFGDEHEHEHEPSSAMSIQPSMSEPDEIGAGGVNIDVVDGSDDMLSLMQKLGGVEDAGSEDYADEEEYGYEDDGEETCNECGGMMEAGHSCGSKEMVDEVETEDQMEFEVAEDNAPDSDEAETSADEDAEAEEDAALAGADSGDDEEVTESFFEMLQRLDSLAEDSGDESKNPEHDKKDDKDHDDEEDEDDDEEDVTEGLNEWANQTGKGPGKGTEASFEQDIDFMTKVIAGGLNKPKSTGQTTVPVIAGQDERMTTKQSPVSDSVDDWVKLAGIK